MASTIFQVEQQLVNWQLSLPSSVNLVEEEDLQGVEGNPLHRKFRVILSLRYYSTRILCHRPVLDRHLQLMNDGEDPSGATLRQIGQLSKTACLRSARAIIEIVSTCTVLHDCDGALAYLGAWWFTLYYSKILLRALSLDSSY